MTDRTISIEEAAKDLEGLIDESNLSGDSVIVLKSGEPVAKIVPCERTLDEVSGTDWLKRWREMPHLDQDDADDFAHDLEKSKSLLLQPESKWE